MERKIYFENEGMTVVGILNMPKSPRLGVVLVHGLTGNKDEANGLFKDTARRFARNHIATLRIDCRNSKPWDGAPNESDGYLANMRPEDWISDTRKAVKYLKRKIKDRLKAERKALDACKNSVGNCAIDLPRKALIGVLGISYGALTSAVASAEDDRIKFLVTWSAPATDIYKEVSPLKAVSKTDKPKLFVHGTEDKNVPFVESKKLYKKARPPRNIVLIEGADHVYSNHKQEAIGETLAWLKGLL